MRRDPEAQEQEAWSVLPPQIRERIQHELDTGGMVVLLAARRGYAPSVVCRDCGQAQVDDRGVPLTFTTARGRKFVTSDGISEVPAERPCTRCESWNLLPLGIGIERVAEEVAQLFPNTGHLLVASESLATARMQRQVRVAAREPGTIIIGTEALVPLLQDLQLVVQPFGVIVSADSLLALPFWRSRERFVRLVYAFAGVCRTVLLSTRRSEDTAVQSLSVTPEAFWEEETSLRRLLSYPPFGTLITLSVEGTSIHVEGAITKLLEAFSAYTPAALPCRVLSPTRIRRTVVLHVADGMWPDAVLAAHIRTLPPGIRVRIDPESLG